MSNSIQCFLSLFPYTIHGSSSGILGKKLISILIFNFILVNFKEYHLSDMSLKFEIYFILSGGKIWMNICVFDRKEPPYLFVSPYCLLMFAFYCVKCKLIITDLIRNLIEIINVSNAFLFIWEMLDWFYFQ